jgi:hypothetical protein
MREAGRGARRAVSDWLRLRRHHRDVCQVAVLAEHRERIEHRPFLVGPSRRHGPAGERRGHLGEHRRRQVDVMWMPRKLQPPSDHRAGDAGAPVTDLGDVPCVATSSCSFASGTPCD